MTDHFKFISHNSCKHSCRDTSTDKCSTLSKALLNSLKEQVMCTEMLSKTLEFDSHCVL